VLELPHTAIGAVIASKIPNPFLAIPLAFLSHFVADFFPHWNPHLYTETKKLGKPTRKSNIIVACDTAFSLIFGFFVAFRFWPNTGRILTTLATCFAAVAPDAVEGLYFYLGVKTKFLEKLIEFQHKHQFNINLIPGLISQGVVLVICFYLILSR